VISEIPSWILSLISIVLAALGLYFARTRCGGYHLVCGGGCGGGGNISDVETGMMSNITDISFVSLNDTPRVTPNVSVAVTNETGARPKILSSIFNPKKNKDKTKDKIKDKTGNRKPAQNPASTVLSTVAENKREVIFANSTFSPSLAPDFNIDMWDESGIDHASIEPHLKGQPRANSLPNSNPFSAFSTHSQVTNDHPIFELKSMDNYISPKPTATLHPRTAMTLPRQHVTPHHRLQTPLNPHLNRPAETSNAELSDPHPVAPKRSRTSSITSLKRVNANNMAAAAGSPFHTPTTRRTTCRHFPEHLATPSPINESLATPPTVSSSTGRRKGRKRATHPRTANHIRKYTK
jgi:hypothetical protein